MFLVFAVVNNAAESIHMPDFCVDSGFFLGCIRRGGISGSSDNSVQCFEELLDCVPWQVHRSASPAAVDELPVSAQPLRPSLLAF